jgi:hypothetical protein
MNEVSLKAGMEKTNETVKRHRLGTVGVTKDGRKFRYAFSSAAIPAGTLVMQLDITDATHDTDMVIPTAVAVGATSFVVTNQAVAFAANDLADGYFYVNDNAGEGSLYAIKSNAAATTTGPLTLTLEEDDPINVALTTSSQVGVRDNPYLDCEAWDADDIDGIPLGWAVTPVADNEYFWCQTHGPVAALFDAGSVGVKGRVVIPSVSVDGAVRGYDLASGSVTSQDAVGRAMMDSVASEFCLVFATVE